MKPDNQQYNSNQENPENTATYNRISKVSWLIINNNPVTTHVFMILNVIDFIYLALMILCIYDISEPTSRLILLISVCGVHLIVLMALVLMSFQKVKINRKYLIVKIISTYFPLLKTFLMTFTMIVISDNYSNFKSGEQLLKFLNIIIVCGIVVVVILLTYFSANFINLFIPNAQVPWSESSTYPTLVETVFKLIIGLNFVFRDHDGFREGLLATQVLLKGYILLYRLKKSYIYNTSLFLQYLIQDCIILHLLMLVLYSTVLNTKYNYYAIAISLTPISLLLLKYLHHRFIIGNLENNLECQDEIVIANSFIRLLQINLEQASSDQNILIGLHYKHYLKCRVFQKSQFRILERRYEKRLSNQQRDDQRPYNDNEEEKNFTISGMPYNDLDLNSMNTFTLPINTIQNKASLDPAYLEPIQNNSTNIVGSTFLCKNEIRDVESINVYVSAKFKNKKKQGHSQANLSQNEIFNNKRLPPRSRKSLFDFKRQQRNFTEDKHELINEMRKKKESRIIIDETKKEKMITKLLKHYNKYHLGDVQSKNLNLNILQAYSSLKLIKNIYHAQFLLIKYSTNYNTEKYITKTKAFIHEQYFEQLIEQIAQTQQESDDKVNLQKMLDLNQLLAEFDITVNILTNEVLKFWSDLYNEKNAMSIYQRGLSLSQNLTHLQRVYSDIESKQLEQSELKIYIQMAAFNKFVVFKEPQYQQEIQKYRQAIETRKIMYGKHDIDKERGLILSKINLNKAMKVSFINQKAAKLIKYKQKEAVGLPINSLMPKLVSDNHHLMVSNFLKKGNTAIINKRRMIFIKQSNEHILPVNMQLQFNILDLKSMIVVLEKVSKDELKPFGDLEEDQQFGIISLTKELLVQETSKECERICLLNNMIIQRYQTVYNKFPELEDLFQIDTESQSISQLLEQGYTEFQARIKFMELIEHSIGSSTSLNLKQIMHSQEAIQFDVDAPIFHKSTNDNQQNYDPGMAKIIKKFQSNNNTSIQNLENKVFIIRIQSEYYMNKRIQQKVLYIRNADSSAATASFKFASLQTINYQSPQNVKLQQPKETYQEEQYQKLQSDANELLYASSQNNSDELEIQSMSSQQSSNSSLSNLVNSFSLENDSTESTRIPRTLKFVLQLVIFVVLLILATSSVSLALISSNFEAINMSIKMSSFSIARLNCITQVRLLMRVLVNIAEGYNTNTNQILSDRCTFYTSLINDLLEELRLSENYIDSQDTTTNKIVGKVDLEFMTSLASLKWESRSLPDSVQMYIDRGNEIIDMIMKGGGCNVLFSYLVYFWIPINDIYEANIKERSMYFLIQNGNQDLFYKLTKYAEVYVDNNASNIESKSNFSSYMTWVCMTIIVLCFLVIVPLLGKIQERLQVLMNIFFTVDRKLKESMIEKINQYTEMNIFKNTKEILKQDHDERKNRNQHHKKKKKTIAREDSDEKKKKVDFVKAMATIQEEPSQEENEDEDSDPENVDKKTKKHHSSNNNVKEQERSQMVFAFKQQIFRRKVKQSLGIMAIMIALLSYFLGTYVMSQKSFGEMSESVDILFILLQRKSCTENVIHAIVEGYQWNDTYLINHGQDEIMKYFVDKCLNLEKNYQKKVVSDQPAFLESVTPYLRSLEDGSFCQDVFANGDGFAKQTVNSSMCKSIMGGISSHGLTNIFSTVYTQAQQYQLSYYSAFERVGVRDFKFIVGGISAASVYLDLVTTIVSKPQKLLASRVVNSLENYFNGQLANFYIFYSCFVCIICIFTFIFFFSKFISNWLIFGVGIFRKMRKEMILSNKMLYVIDFELITQQERDNISTFLSKY